MADEAKRIHVNPGVGARMSMARPRSKSHRPSTEAQGLAGERASSGGARAPEATVPVRECGGKYQVSWDATMGVEGVPVWHVAPNALSDGHPPRRKA